jgi:hypothetical protein
MLTKDCVNSCWTGQVLGLSNQIIEVMNDLQASCLMRISHPMISCEGAQNNPYLQKGAIAGLLNAVAGRNRVLVINSCFRTIAQQYLLRSQYEQELCGIMAAAQPGQSNHGSGLAIDIEDAQGWKPYLEKYGWRWLGAFDPMHFDYVGNIGQKDLNQLQILAFQRLWNQHNPQQQIPEDGSWGNVTNSKMSMSPADGFGVPATLRKGMASKEVGQLQLALRQALALAPNQLAADTRFGSTTERYVTEFQRSRNLTADGIAGLETLKALNLA